MDHELSVDLILQSLPDSYSQFVLNFQMNKIEVTIPELINMLKTAEPSIKKDQKAIMLVDSSSKRKSQGKKKKKKMTMKPKGGVKKKDAKGQCFHCNKSGH